MSSAAANIRKAEQLGNPLEKFGITEDDIMATEEVKAGKLKTAYEAAEYWRGVPTGNYQGDIGVITDGDDVKVGDSRDVANLIEDGSEHNDAYGPRAKTETKFNNRGGIEQV